MPAILALLRAAIPFTATLLSGFALGDLFQTVAYRKSQNIETPPQKIPGLLPEIFKRNPAKWKFLAVGALAMGAITVFITKKLK